MTQPFLQRCGQCGQDWWDAHVCPATVKATIPPTTNVLGAYVPVMERGPQDTAHSEMLRLLDLSAKQAAELERLRQAGQILVDAYRERFKKPSTRGLRSSAPLLAEFAEFNAALQKKA